ncbi:MAG: hypothetical protein LBG52_01155 [Candidatus Peribacteria bacterium]|jgi:hypothetical protein|nr:hypothetical protein [Candidatus Peribacteria bacterium]
MLTRLQPAHKKANQAIQKLLTLWDPLVDEEKMLIHFETLIKNSQVLHPQGDGFFLALPQEKSAISFF